MNLLTKFKSIIPIVPVQDYKQDENLQSITKIPVHMIKPNPHQPRRIFDEDSINELSESIKKYGVIQPITVRQLAENRYELIAGERRLRACKKSGLLKIPAIIVDMNDNDCAVVALIENLQRENLSFMEEAEAYRNLLSNHGFTQDELAVRLGKNQSSVANKVRLLKLPLVVREIIKDNNLTERHARTLLRLDSCEKQLHALEMITDGNLNVAQTEELIDKMICPDVEKEEIKTELPQKHAVKDVRIFVNTVRHAIDVMKKHGVDALSTETEYDDYFEYVIHIPKEKQ